MTTSTGWYSNLQIPTGVTESLPRYGQKAGLPEDDGSIPVLTLKLLLTSLSTRLTNRYLVTRIIQCPPDPSQPSSNITTPLYSVAKPFIWHRNESAGSVSERSGGELRGETKGDQVMVNDIDEMML